MARVLLVFSLFLFISPLYGSGDLADTRVIYSTDLFLDGDFDDYFDLVALYSLNFPNVDIILDQGDVQLTDRSGRNAVSNLNKITKKSPNVFIGLDQKLTSTSQIGNGSNQLLLENIDRLLNEVRRSEKVNIITVGSLRDVAALYIRDPDLLHEKVEKLYVFAGDYRGTYLEHNVDLDEYAYLSIMNSGLPIYWIPCFEEGVWTSGENSSYFTVTHNEIFNEVDSELLDWFLFRYEQRVNGFMNYEPSDETIDSFMLESRNIWCAPLFTLINNSYNNYYLSYIKENGFVPNPIGFERKRLLFQEGGRVIEGKGNEIEVIKITNREDYANICKYILKKMISEF